MIGSINPSGLVAGSYTYFFWEEFLMGYDSASRAPSIGNCRRFSATWMDFEYINLSRCQVDQAVKRSVFAQCQGGGMVQTSTLPFLHGGFPLVTPQYPSGRVPESTQAIPAEPKKSQLWRQPTELYGLDLAHFVTDLAERFSFSFFATGESNSI